MDLMNRKPSETLLGKATDVLTPEKIEELVKQENAALTMCGGMLGNCYLLAEVCESLMVDALNSFKKEKWFKHTTKKFLKDASSKLHTTIFSSINGSSTNADYMREVADALLEELKPDLFKLKQAILIEVNKHKILYSYSLADMILIDVLLRYIGIEYDDVLEHMKTIYDAYYDSWYYPARCTGPSKLWSEGLESFARKYLPEQLDLNGVLTITNGIQIIQNKIHSSEVSNRVTNQASKYAEEGKGKENYEKALDILNVQKK